MKVLELAALLGGAVSAVSAIASPDGVRRADEVVEGEAMTTITYVAFKTVTQLDCQSATNCPTDGVVFVTTISEVTTTICPLTMTSAVSASISSEFPTKSIVSGSVPGFPGTPISPIGSSALPTSGGVTPTGPGGPPPTGPAAPSSSSDVDFTVQTSTTLPISKSKPVGTGTDAVPTSFAPSSSAYVPGPPHSSGSSAENTNTDSVPTSFPISRSSGYAPPPAHSSGVPSQSASTGSNTDAVATSFTTGHASASTGAPSSSDVATTIRRTSTSVVTSIITLTSGQPSSLAPSSVAAPLSSSSVPGTIVPTPSGPHESGPLSSVVVPGTSSEIDALPTSIGTISGQPSGWPNATINGTIVHPSPTMTPYPIETPNFGKVVNAGKSSIVAIIVAMVFAHFV